MTVTAEIRSDAAPAHSPTAGGRSLAAYIDAAATTMVRPLISIVPYGGGFRGHITRYAALMRLRAVLLRAAELVYAEASTELAEMHRRRRPDGTRPNPKAIAAGVTRLVHQISESEVRRRIKLAAGSAAAE